MSRIGALTPFLGIEDSTGSGDLLFLERASARHRPQHRGLRPAAKASICSHRATIISCRFPIPAKRPPTPPPSMPSRRSSAAPHGLRSTRQNFKWLLDARRHDVFSLADAAANTNASNVFSFSNGPELAVDSTKTVNTGNIDAKKVTANSDLNPRPNMPASMRQGGWDPLSRHPPHQLCPTPVFPAGIAQATYSLTGEAHAYDPTTASFRNLVPANPAGPRAAGAPGKSRRGTAISTWTISP